MIGSEDLRAFARDGYLVFEEFVDPQACAELQERALELVAERSVQEPRAEQSVQFQLRDSDDYFLGSGEDVRLFYEEDAFDDEAELRRPVELSVNKLGHAMHDLDPVFDRFSRTPDVAAVADGIGLVDPLLLQSMYIFKQPQIGGEFVPHCDHTYLWTEPASVVGFWFAIEDATVDNGALSVLPGGHGLSPRERFRVDAAAGPGMEDLGAPEYDVQDFAPLEVSAGTLVVLDGLLPHCSSANRSDWSRHAYTVHLISGRARYLPDNWLQRSTLPLRGFSST